MAVGGGHLQSACGGMATPTSAGLWMAGQGVMASCWSHHMEHLRGAAAPNGAGPLGGGMKKPTQSLVAV